MGIIWEDRPAQAWMEAYPLGNGRMGAMVFGGFEKERVQLNLDTLWYGGHVDRINPEARENLERVRELLLGGNIPEAEELMRFAFSGTPQSQRPYQPFGNLELWYQYAPAAFSDGDMDQKREDCNALQGDSTGKKTGMDLEAGAAGKQEVLKPVETGYRRELDLNRGLVEECFTLENGARIHKTYLISYPAQVMAICIRTEGDVQLSGRMLIRRSRFYEQSGKINDHTIFMQGQSGPEGVHFYGAVSAYTPNGTVQAMGEHLSLKRCREVYLFVAGETDFRGEDPEQAVRARLAAAEEKGWEALMQEHLADYQRLYGRVELHLGPDADVDQVLSDESEKSFCGDMPFHQRLREQSEDPKLAEAYFQFGRYLMVTGSRPASLPLTLQGIWNDDYVPSWDSKYTININTEMNYWPAESLNLSECHLPLFDMIRRMCETGKDTARRMYGCRGFTAHHNTDIWADTAPQDLWIPGTYWVLGGGWLCTHIMTHYRYTRDIAFLREMYPCLQEAVRFFQDFLIEDRGELVICPSVSPENTYIMSDGTQGSACVSSTMDTAILRDLMQDYLEASRLLEQSDELVRWTEESLGSLPKFQVGKHGQLMEWREDYDELEPGHRHISHLYALYPSDQISRERTPELAQAADRTIDRRLAHGGGYTGWSCAWIICMFARLERGEDAYQNLLKLLRESTADNMMDTHPTEHGPVFQIDGNMGAAAGIAELLVQSKPGRLKLLPALPKAWPEGYVKGIRLMGGALVQELVWKNGRVKRCVIQAGAYDFAAEVFAGGMRQMIRIPAGSEQRIVI